MEPDTIDIQFTPPEPFEKGLIVINPGEWIQVEIRKPKGCEGPRDYGQRWHIRGGQLGWLVRTMADLSKLPVWPRGEKIAGCMS